MDWKDALNDQQLMYALHFSVVESYEIRSIVLSFGGNLYVHIQVPDEKLT